MTARDRLVGWWQGTGALTADANPAGLTGAVLALRAGRDNILPRYEHWQDEAWGYWSELGELYYGIRWLAEMISRIRLVAATEPESPGDEPAPVDGGGTPVDLIERFGGGLGGQAELLRRLVVQLQVPGEGWLVGEPGSGDQPDLWSVRSADEIRRSTRSRASQRALAAPTAPTDSPARTRGSSLARLGDRGRGYNVEVVDEQSLPGGQQRWRLLAADALVNRIWNPHDRYYVQADSPTRHALATARKLQLANRYIQAQFLSRLASAGLFVLPDNIDLPVSPEFEGTDDAVIREWVQTAATAIQQPGSAAAVVPLLMQLPPDVIDKLKFVDFTTAFDQKTLEKRDQAVRELATVLDLPAEILLGLGESNHWTAWQLEESALKVHVAPRIEMICHAFTDGWYRPMLQAAGEDPTRFRVWYDPSEIVVRPDKSEKVVVAYDRGEASGEALRREQGLDEGDKPEDDALLEWALKQLVLGKGGEALVPVAFKMLTGTEIEPPAPPAPAAPAQPEGGQPAEDGDQPPTEGGRPTPDTQTQPPPTPDEGVPPPAAAAGASVATMAAPHTGWPMERRPDGWWVRNVTHWERLPPEQTAILDRRWAELAIHMNGRPGAELPTPVGG